MMVASNDFGWYRIEFRRLKKLLRDPRLTIEEVRTVRRGIEELSQVIAFADQAYS